VLVAGNAALVFDQAGKKLWETKLSFPVIGGMGVGGAEETPPLGQGPCVEREDILYVFDAGTLAAFDLATGNARWRLPSVGVAGLFFDDKGMMYVNTTTASGESLKYSHQIDVSQKTRQVVLKLNAKTGKILWQTEAQGLVSYVSGKFIYTTESYEGDPGDGVGDGIGVKTGFEVPPHIRIKRLNPSNGRILWEHYEGRAPLDVRFDANTIQLLFRKEMEILKFTAL
jgi:outer membrane protein assembly factor BamB